MSRASTLLRTALAVALFGCLPPSVVPDGGSPDGAHSTCAVPYWGEPSAPAKVELGMRFGNGFRPVTFDGEAVDLEFPVQGGHVLFVAARLQNMDGCAVELSARLLHPDNGEVIAQEKRSVDFTVQDGVGAVPVLAETANSANVPACPAFGPRDIVGAPWHLEVRVKDRTGKEAAAQQLVIPSCRQADAQAKAACECECTKNYYLGKCG